MLHFAAGWWQFSPTWVIYSGIPQTPTARHHFQTSHGDGAHMHAGSPALTWCANLFISLYLSHLLHAALKKGDFSRGGGGGAHKDKNHISLEGACVTVIYAASILPPHWDGSEFWVAKSISVKAVGAGVGGTISSLLSIFRGQRVRSDKGRRTWPPSLMVNDPQPPHPQEDCG